MDENEGIELCGKAGTSLAEWRVILYDMDGIEGKTTKIDDVTLDDSGNGFGFYQLNIVDLPNDITGIALVDSGDNIIQFISYEGVVTAAQGLANGQTSVDIGVAENEDTSSGQSLQLKDDGDGNPFWKFKWNSASDSTFGQINSDQTFAK